jgi:PAS domain S-box-containing protein
MHDTNSRKPAQTPGKKKPRLAAAGVDKVEGKRRQVGAALRSSAEDYRSLFTNMLDGFAHCQMLYENGEPQDFIYLDVNPAFELLTGLKNAVGRKVTEIIPGIRLTNPELFEIYGRVALTRQPERFETYVEQLDTWFSVSVYSNQAEHFIAVFENITARKRIEEELARSQQMLQLVLDNIPQRVFWKDMNSVYLGCNKAHAEVIRLESPDQIIGKDDFQFYSRENAEQYRLNDRRILATGEPWLYYEETELLPDGRLVWDRTSKVPLRDTGENVIGVLGIYEDITERKRLSDELHRYVERLSVVNHLDRLITSSLDLGTVYEPFVQEMRKLVAFDRTAVVVFNEAGDQWSIAYQWVNGASAFSPGVWRPLKGSPIGWVAEHKQVYLEGRLGEVSHWAEDGLLEQDGIQSRVLLPLFNQGEVSGLMTLGSRNPNEYSRGGLDLLQSLADQLAIAVRNANLYNEIRLAAAALEKRVEQRTAELEFANQNLESFSYSVSHDLRAPLRAIKGFAQILESRYRDNLSAEGRHYLDNIVEASERMGALIEDLLKYSRIGRTSVNREPVLLEDILAHAVSDLEGRIQQVAASMELPPPQSVPEIVSDQTLLSQVFTNLIDNSLVYHQQDVPPHIKITCKEVAGSICIGVSDNGIGIPAEYHDKIFNVFQRLHSVDEYPGTGIGLAIVKKSVDLLGGRVWVESNVGQGSTFWVELPKE